MEALSSDSIDKEDRLIILQNFSEENWHKQIWEAL